MAEPETPLILGTGAAAVMDVLGFKAARKVHGVTRLVSAVRRFRDQVERTSKHHGEFGRGAITTATVSDTVIMARQAGETDPEGALVTLGATVQQIAMAASILVTTAAAGTPSLAFRGCIAAGSLVVADGDIFVGDAIDEAAELAEQAMAAMVWLAPSARAVLEKEAATLSLLEWPVRLHDRGEVTVLVVNPFWLSAAMAGSAQGAEQTLRALLVLLMRPFAASNAIDVVQKRQNTEQFLEYAKELTISRWDEIQTDAFPEGRSNAQE